MLTFLSILLVVVALLGTWVPMWVAFVPRLGVWPLYYLWPLRAASALVTVGTAGALAILAPSPGTLTALACTCLLAVMSVVANPARLLPTLIHPPHVPAAEAELAGDARVLGHATDTAAHAWAVELIVPHHLIVDRVGETPVLAAW